MPWLSNAIIGGSACPDASPMKRSPTTIGTPVTWQSDYLTGVESLRMRIKSEPARSQLYDTLPPKRPPAPSLDKGNVPKRYPAFAHRHPPAAPISIGCAPTH